MLPHYGAAYHEVIRTSGEEKLNRRWGTHRKRVLNISKEGTLLDIGCGSGSFLRALKDTDLELYGIEIAAAQAREAEFSTGARVFAGSIENAPFAPHAFDVITCFHVLEHLHRLEQVIGRVRDWLKPGGHFYIIVPNVSSAEATLFRSYWHGLELPRHLYHFSPESLARLLTPFHFDTILMRTKAECYIERSMQYVFDATATRLGIPHTLPALSQDHASIPWRAVRKAFRSGILVPFRHLSAVAGRGAAIEAIFRTPL